MKKNKALKDLQYFQCLVADKIAKRKNKVMGQRPPYIQNHRKERNSKKIVIVGMDEGIKTKKIVRSLNEFIVPRYRDPIIVTWHEPSPTQRRVLRWAVWNWLRVSFEMVNYKKFKPAKKAERKRNEKLVGRADVVIVFWNGDNGEVEDVLDLAKEQGKKLKVFIV